MQIIAHRGASFYAPENTLEAFRLGLEQGAGGIELDVRLTADAQVVCLHDKTTLRTTGKRYDISRFSYETVKNLDAGSWKNKRFGGERIPLLADVLSILPSDRQIYIEIKCGTEIIPCLMELLEGRYTENAVIFGFGYDTVKEIKQVMPEYRVLWIGEFGFNIKGGADLYKKAEYMVREAGLDGFSTKNVKTHCIEMRRLLPDKMFNVWTVDDVKEGSFYKNLGITSLTTNRPDIMLSF